MPKARKRSSATSKKATDSARELNASYYRAQGRSVPRRVFWGRVLISLVIAAVLLFGLFMTWLDEAYVEGDLTSSTAEQVQAQLQRQYHFVWQPYLSPPEQVLDYPGYVSESSFSVDWQQRTLTVFLKRYQAVLAWSTQGSVYELDERGYVLGEVTAAGSLPLVEDSSNLEVGEGEQVLTQEFIDFALAVHGSDLKIERLRVADTTGELYADLEDGYFIRFNTAADAALQLENVARVRRVAADNGDIIRQYIDVRIPYKAFYR